MYYISEAGIEQSTVEMMHDLPQHDALKSTSQRAFLRIGIVFLLPFLLLACTQVDQDRLNEFMANQPVIDVHLHALPGVDDSEYYRGDDLDQAILDFTLGELDANNIVLALTGGTKIYADKWGAADSRFVVGPTFPCFDGLDPNIFECEEFPDLEELRESYSNGQYGSMGEVYYVYYGIPPTDRRMDPYWALAEEFGIPVGVHADSGPASLMREEGCCPEFNGEYGNPLLLEPVLEKYPNLKLYLMHYGNSDYKDAAIALMKKYKNVYCEITAVSLFAPKMFWQSSVRELFEEGLEDRLMFGSDYAGTIKDNIEIIFSLDWITEDQKRAIFYDNAARFLELSADDIARHRASVSQPDDD